ncbi:MAG: hypothetical protein HXY36_04010 [Chloroflexi bacterium]|nr:hypothetical protein [Chloroflexota bacterium]
MARLNFLLIVLVLLSGMVACEEQRSPTVEIWDWSDLNAIRNNLSGRYVLMRDLDSATDSYKELASETANQGKGWQPIGTSAGKFTGTFDGQGFEIKDLCMNRPGEGYVGLFGVVAGGGTIKNIGVVNAYVIGDWCVGSLAGVNWGTVSNSYSTGSVSGTEQVGGLIGGTVAL